MEQGVTDIVKTDGDIERCSKIVAEVIKREFDEETLKELTIQIMDTSLIIGGDFGDDTIQQIANQYVNNGGIERFLKGQSK